MYGPAAASAACRFGFSRFGNSLREQHADLDRGSRFDFADSPVFRCHYNLNIKEAGCLCIYIGFFMPGF